MHPRWYYAFPIGVTLVAFVGFAIAHGTATDDLEALAWQASARRATLDAPVEGPAIYTGILVAPPGRTTTTGVPVAASWWWVQTVRKNDTTTHCSAKQRDDLSLQWGAKTVPITFLADDNDVSLVADTRDDWTGHAMIDIGGSPITDSKTIGGAAAQCAGDGRKIVERWIPPNTTVEVVACFDHGALGPCAGGAMRGVLAVENEKRHRQRRVNRALLGTERAGLISAIMLMLSTILVARMRARTAPEGEAEGSAS